MRHPANMCQLKDKKRGFQTWMGDNGLWYFYYCYFYYCYFLALSSSIIDILLDRTQNPNLFHWSGYHSLNKVNPWIFYHALTFTVVLVICYHPFRVCILHIDVCLSFCVWWCLECWLSVQRKMWLNYSPKWLWSFTSWSASALCPHRKSYSKTGLKNTVIPFDEQS